MARLIGSQMHRLICLVLLLAGIGGLATPAMAEAILMSRFPTPTQVSSGR